MKRRGFLGSLFAAPVAAVTTKTFESEMREVVQPKQLIETHTIGVNVEHFATTCGATAVSMVSMVGLFEHSHWTPYE